MSRPRRRFSDRLFAFFVRLFPGDFRDDFGKEMLEAFHDDHDESADAAGARGRLTFWARAFGGVLRTAPAQHVDVLRADTRYALRSMRRRPLFTLIAVASLAIGIASTTTVVALYDTLFVTTGPGIVEPEGLINLHTKRDVEETFTLMSYPNYADLRDGVAEAVEVAGFFGARGSLAIEAGSEPESVSIQVTTWNYVSVLGGTPLRGRLFTPDDEREGRRVALISSWLWENRFGSDPQIVGREVHVNGTVFTVIGVGPDGFRNHFVGFNSDLFLPVSALDVVGFPPRTDRESEWVEMIGRLAPGVSTEQAAAAIGLETERLVETFPELNRGLEISVSPSTGIDPDLRGGLLSFVVTLLVVAALVLLIACGNVMNMILARVSDRHREMALRMALGARRRRLVRQLLTENALLALFGGVAGTLLAVWATGASGSAFSAFGHILSIEPRVGGLPLAAALAITTASALLFGLVPALRASATDPAIGLRTGGERSGAGGTRFRSALVVFQVALSLVILIGAGLFLRALQHATRLDTGFDSQTVFAVNLDPRLMGMAREMAPSILPELLRAARELPETEVAALVDNVPLSLGARFFPNPITLEIPGHTPKSGLDGFAVEHAIVSDGYFDTLRIPLVEGRDFGAGDDAEARPVAIVNRAFADRFFGDASPVGLTLRKDERELLIVGVARNSKYRTLTEETTPFVYLHLPQEPRPRIVLLARPRVRSAAFPASVTGQLHDHSPFLPLGSPADLDDRLAISMLPQRVAGTVVGLLGIVGLFLTAVGLYGVIAYSVNRRRAEIGVRMSLGASPRDVLGRVVRQGLTLVSIGLAFGLPAAALASGYVRKFLYGLSPIDATTYVSIALIFLATAFVASLGPALRAARTDPIRVLRE